MQEVGDGRAVEGGVVTYKQRCEELRAEVARLQSALAEDEARQASEEAEMASRERYAARKEASAVDSLRVHSEMRAAWTVRGYKTWFEFLSAHDAYRDKCGAIVKKMAKGGKLP